MVKVLVHRVGLKERIQISTIVVVDIGAEIRIRIVEVQKGRAVMTGKTQSELPSIKAAGTGHYQGRLTAHRFQPLTGLIVIGSCRIGPCYAVHMVNSWIMTGKALRTELTVTCMIVAVINTCSCVNTSTA